MSGTSLTGAVVLVTGANGGLGAHFVQQALARGAAKVYATARTPRDWGDERIVSLALDVTDPASIAAAAQTAADTTVMINNAGIGRSQDSLIDGSLEQLRELFETNFFGPIAVTRAFAPVIAGNGGGAIVQVASLLSWLAADGSAGYSATKSALWSATNSLRDRLVRDGVRVVGLHLGYTDTPLIAGLDVPKGDPADVVAAAYEGLEAGEWEILADEPTRQVRAALAAPLHALYPAFTV